MSVKRMKELPLIFSEDSKQHRNVAKKAKEGRKGRTDERVKEGEIGGDEEKNGRRKK